MRHRSRIPVALIALLTLLVSTTEALWASTCAPEMAAPPPTAEQTAHAEPGCAGEEAGTLPDRDHEQPDPDEQHCPLLALGGGGACVPASLPSRAALQSDLWGGRQAWLPRVTAEPAPRFTPPPFHPPKA